MSIQRCVILICDACKLESLVFRDNNYYVARKAMHLGFKWELKIGYGRELDLCENCSKLDYGELNKVMGY